MPKRIVLCREQGARDSNKRMEEGGQAAGEKANKGVAGGILEGSFPQFS